MLIFYIFIFRLLFWFHAGSDNARLLHNSCRDRCPSGSSFHATFSADTFRPTVLYPAKQCGPQIRMHGVGFQLPFTKPHSVHIVVLLGKRPILLREVAKTSL